MNPEIDATLRMPPRWRARTVDEAQRQVGERAAVEIDHRELVGAIERVRLTEQAIARIVDQEGRLELARLELAGDPVRAVGTREIDREDMRRAMAGVADALGDRGELRNAPRRQHDLVAVLGEDLGKRGPDPRRSAGDQVTGLSWNLRDPARARGPVHIHRKHSAAPLSATYHVARRESFTITIRMAALGHCRSANPACRTEGLTSGPLLPTFNKHANRQLPALQIEVRMSFFPGKDPAAGDRSACDALETVVVPRSVDLDGFSVRRALPHTEPADGRAVRLFRSFRAGRVQKRSRARCPAASAYRVIDPHISL
jgi:hypothetical protein